MPSARREAQSRGVILQSRGSSSSKSRGIHSRLPICIHGCRPPAEGPRAHPVATAGAQGPRLRGRHPRRSRDGVIRPLLSPPRSAVAPPFLSPHPLFPFFLLGSLPKPFSAIPHSFLSTPVSAPATNLLSVFYNFTTFAHFRFFFVFFCIPNISLPPIFHSFL